MNTQLRQYQDEWQQYSSAKASCRTDKTSQYWQDRLYMSGHHQAF
jgi:hypothetical protein